jgi:hypothetical protein
MAITGGSVLNSVPATGQQALSTNYLDLATTANQGWAQQYVPDLMEKEAEVFGPRTISGFLSQVGAEEAMTADQVVWSEQGRLHLSYKGKVSNATGGSVVSGGIIEIETDIDGNDIGTDHGIRVNDTVIIASAGGVCKALVTEAIRGTTGGTHDLIEVAPYGVQDLSNAGITETTAQALTILVYGSEFQKGRSYNTSADVGNNGTATDQRTANEPSFKSFMNKPIIMKDYYEVSGSDASRIGWIEVSTEAGQSGYLWYLKAESDTRARFTDYLEMAMLEARMGGAAVTAATPDNGHPIVPAADLTDDAFDLAAGTATGTQGLFDAIETRGNVSSGILGSSTPPVNLAEFDAILAEFDKQGAIEENMLFCNRDTSLAIDDMLAGMNSYGANGTSYGVFDNSEDMALNLGFSGFRRGSYDFYKSDFRYLNDLATRGGINAAAGSNAIRGVFIPAGSSSVYDQTVGQSIRRPFLHVRYRASQTDDRRMKTWVTGSVGAATSALDAMQLHFLSERCLITQGANNFMLLK